MTTKFEEVLPRLVSLLACGVLAAGVSACGGSASETPAPLEPTSNPRAPYARTTPPSSLPAQQPKRADDPNASADGESLDPEDARESAPEAEPPGTPASGPASPE